MGDYAYAALNVTRTAPAGIRVHRLLVYNPLSRTLQGRRINAGFRQVAPYVKVHTTPHQNQKRQIFSSGTLSSGQDQENKATSNTGLENKSFLNAPSGTATTPGTGCQEQTHNTDGYRWKLLAENIKKAPNPRIQPLNVGASVPSPLQHTDDNCKQMSAGLCVCVFACTHV